MRRRNAFTGDKSYSQTWSLTYRETVTESRCAQDWVRLVPWLLTWWQGGLLLFATVLWMYEKASLLQTVGLAALIAISTQTQGLLLTRVLWVCINTCLCRLAFPHHASWTQSDYFASAFPGFICSKQLVRPAPASELAAWASRIYCRSDTVCDACEWAVQNDSPSNAVLDDYSRYVGKGSKGLLGLNRLI
jgi:hypothetical protein